MLRTFARLLLRIYFSHRILEIDCLLLLIAGATLFTADHVMANASQQLTRSDVNAVLARSVGSSLGTGPGNRHLTRHIDITAELYHAGKMKWLLISDDSRYESYDEASGIQQVLIAKGVPTKMIFYDYAGFPTPDSVVRAKKVLGESRIIIVSREFHNQHTIWLIKQYGIDTIGFSAPDLNMRHGFYTQLWEKLARVSAVIDAKILYRQPKYPGPLVMVGPFSEHGRPAKEQCISAHVEDKRGVLRW